MNEFFFNSILLFIYFQIAFPKGPDGVDDFMILSDRRDILDTLMKDILANVNYQIYQPLAVFIRADEGIKVLEKKIVACQRRIRRFLSRLHFNLVGRFKTLLLLFILLI